ncbi:hypothetical protein [Corynebacterium aquatimens]|uniref:Uncharacterized protein n=1 Tax=Corynebacterium aquatimens TaxID=1190508 RepID=A0A931GT47_9CORY|nr:hypothetical protein [Corynebacterium aquatimens]MBG6122652.1 hypothetical protein [Corynebacterium aquatimens]WJY64810.1 hypothetical protein CAQUA_00295 [Corynebacterium aquatimens]
MNLRTARMAYRLASMAYGRYRNLDKEKQRDLYEAVRAMALNEGRAHEDEERAAQIAALSSRTPKRGKKAREAAAARRQAGAVTRAAHDRLDERRLAFAQAVQDKKVAAKLEKKARKEQRKQKSTKVGAGVGILALLSAIAAAVYYFFVRDDRKDSAPSSAPTHERKNLNPAPVKPVKNAPVKKEPTHGPLSEEPAERDEALLSSIEDQLSTLDTLDDDQRQATDPRH